MLQPQNPFSPPPPPPAPNTVLVSRIVITTQIVAGAAKTSAIATLQPAFVDENGSAKILGLGKQLVIADLANLDGDIASVAPQITAAAANVEAAIDAINAIRKIV